MQLNCTTLLLSLLAPAAVLLAGEAENKRIESAAVTIEEIMAVSDKAIPQDLFAKAECAVVVPGLKKGAFIVGAKYGRGFAVCRKTDGVGWTAPAAMRVEGGSVGFQIGGSESDVIMLVMNKAGMQKLLKSKFTLGGDAAVAAGPVGRESSAQTDAMMRAEILSWSRSRGVFAGISLQGATLRPDRESNEIIYGKEVSYPDILTGKAATPPAAERLIATLNKYASRK